MILYKTIERADAIVLMTEWDEHRGMDFDKVKHLMMSNVIVDLRNVCEQS